MLKVIKEAKEIVSQKNKNLALIGQQYRILEDLEVQIKNSKADLKDSKQEIENYRFKTKVAADKLSEIELRLFEGQKKFTLFEKELFEQVQLRDSLKAEEKYYEDKLRNLEREIKEKEDELNEIEKEIIKSPEDKKIDKVTSLLIVLKQCIKLKEHSEKYYTF